MRRSTGPRVTAFLALAVALSSCGGGAAPRSGDRSCHASSTILNVTAKNSSFSADCLAAPADTPFRINFDNHDPGVPHNVSIYAQDGQGDRTPLFKGDLLEGIGFTTYHVGALPAGEYRFQCDVHPATMNGPFIVEGQP